MAEEEQPRILVVDDNQQLRRLVTLLLKGESYALLEASDGRQGLTLGFTEKPDLILLDCSMPGMDGWQVLARLRSHLLTRHIPVILLTALGEVEDRVRGLQAGADDYIIKPFNTDELTARVEAVLRRSQRDLAADPLTKLPGNLVLRQELSNRLVGDKPFALAYIDVNQFKSYVDHYGFELASQVIQRVGQLVYNMVVEEGQPEDFIGHIGGDDFVLLTDPERVEPLCQAVVEGFEAMVAGFYDPADHQRGHLEGVDRYGVRRRFPLISLSIAIIDVRRNDFADRQDLAAFAARCKEEAKGGEGSHYQRFCRPHRQAPEDSTPA